MVSGIFGLVLQNIIPTRLIRSTPAETIYDQIDHVLVKIREEANAIARPILAQQAEALNQVEERQPCRRRPSPRRHSRHFMKDKFFPF